MFSDFLDFALLLPKQAQQLEDDIRNGPTTLANTEQEVLRAFEWSKKQTQHERQIKKNESSYSRLIELKLQDIVEIICHRFLYENMSIFLNDLLYNL